MMYDVNSVMLFGKFKMALRPSTLLLSKLSHANEVMKLTERHETDTYRCVYAAKFEKAIYVLHVFQKKSMAGIATPKRDIDLVYNRLERAKAEYNEAFPPEPPPASLKSGEAKKRGKKK